MSRVDVQPALAAIAEPTRFRIVELLSAGACTVGEVAAGIGALQPQTTKHIQTLEVAGVIRVHKLGRRRVARLNRETMAGLSSFFANLGVPEPDDAALEDYEAAIVRESATAPPAADARALTFERRLRSSAADVWAAWTEPRRAARWWAPRHFAVEALDLAPHEGAPIRYVLREPDGTRYESAGRVVEAVATTRLVFELAPIDAGGVALFAARHTVTLTAEDAGTVLTLRIDVSDVRGDAAAAVAGLEPGWSQLLDALEELLAH
ncbi:SRPBCC domain-containing protein [Microbacterium timonense]|uniref:SRPBCC domain-containing protein n=1 Tax=Microbacterium timonense TaxID=2086576 RepID=UPI000D10476F